MQWVCIRPGKLNALFQNSFRLRSGGGPSERYLHPKLPLHSRLLLSPAIFSDLACEFSPSGDLPGFMGITLYQRGTLNADQWHTHRAP